MKKSIKILTFGSMAILLFVCIALTVSLFLMVDTSSKVSMELYKAQVEIDNLKKELQAYNPTTTDTFANTQDLMNAIKHNPSHYNSKVVVVEGLVRKTEGEISLANFKEKGYSGYLGRIITPFIPIIIPDTLQQSVVGYGDYIRLKGTVTISNDKVYLDNCTYIMIQTAEEQ